ncbi:hypothetical protein UY3_06257 [Chelonia mydas]|uniref:Uncharacterized protein n=1 Tax=Chelonia mydas TaxID=8469 RepID=M7C7L5_CHEMY|nr:hypothetical protein UY3_06257 [Chelonia mydas]
MLSGSLLLHLSSPAMRPTRPAPSVLFGSLGHPHFSPILKSAAIAFEPSSETPRIVGSDSDYEAWLPIIWL